MSFEKQQKLTSSWFKTLRDKICTEFENIEKEYLANSNQPITPEFTKEKDLKFKRKKWQRPGGGGGEMSVMKGNVFEKVGVNISTIFGKFSEEFRQNIPGTEKSSEFWASGISLVAHMRSPLAPAIHLNTRFICTEKNWFGGGTDLNPILESKTDIKDFHQSLKSTCDKHNSSYYAKFKEECDKYFYIKHRQELRGAGGIFYDYLNSNNFEQDFAFTRDVGWSFLDIFPKLVRRNMFKKWTKKQREQQLIKRGRYAEFNLIYDRGTKFGLMTDGNVEAILMSLPPIAKWN